MVAAGRGFLAGNRSQGGGETARAKTDDIARRSYYRAEDFAVVDRVTEVANALGLPNMQVALAWVLANKTVTSPIIGASKPHHLEDAVKAMSVKLSEADLKRLQDPYKPHPPHLQN